jgi:hypothetical protein
MSTPRLFQVVDSNATQMCTLVTFQKCDRPYVAYSLNTLKDTILHHIAPGQEQVVFQNPNEGIKFVAAFHKHRGKFVKVHDPSPESLAFIQRTMSLQSLPKKRMIPEHYRSTQSKAASVTYSGIVQQSTTCTIEQQPMSDGSGTTTMTTTQQTITAVMETRFQTIEREVSSQRASQIRIEEHQTRMDNRLSTLESQNSTIGSNIFAMMAHLKIPSAPTHPALTQDITMTDVAHANHATVSECTMGLNPFSTTWTFPMDYTKIFKIGLFVLHSYA